MILELFTNFLSGGIAGVLEENYTDDLKDYHTNDIVGEKGKRGAALGMKE